MKGTADRGVTLDELLGSARVCARSLPVLGLCIAAALVDGIDLQLAGAAGPMLADSLAVRPQALSSVFSAGFVGLMVGSLVIGEVADRVGRRWSLVGSLVIAGIASVLIPVFAVTGLLDIRSLLILRLVTGIGVGGVLPNLLALVVEYAPHRYRGTAVSLVLGGIPAGSLVISLIAASVADTGEWKLMFFVVGAVTVGLALACVAWIPESAEFLLRRGRRDCAANMIARVTSTSLSEDLHVVTKRAERGVGVRAVIASRGSVFTLALWMVMFLNLMISAFVLSWLPILLRGAGIDASVGLTMAGLFSFGGILGAIGMGVAFDVTRPVRALVGGYFVAMVAITLLGWGNSSGVLFAVITVAGAAVIGGQAGVQTYAAQRYSTEIRSAGLGWLLGVGRLGSIFGPLLGGAMIGLGWPVPAMFAAATIPVALAAIGIPVADRFGRE